MERRFLGGVVVVRRLPTRPTLVLIGKISTTANNSKQEQGVEAPCPLAVGDNHSPMPTADGRTCIHHYTVEHADLQADW